jgi:hypothetical protein
MKSPKFEDFQLQYHRAACEMFCDYCRRFTILVNLYYRSDLKDKHNFHKETMKYAGVWGDSLRKCLNSSELSDLSEHSHIQEYLDGHEDRYENDFSDVLSQFNKL